MQSFRCTIAGTTREIMLAQRLRWNVYGEEEGLLPASASAGGREIDARDDDTGTMHFIVYAGDEVAGTVRLLRPSEHLKRVHGGPLGLDLESKWDLRALSAPGIAPAEVTRYCVLRGYRGTGVTTALFEGLYAESARSGITHWVAGANMGTDFAEDAAIAHRVARRRSFVNERFHAETLAHEAPRTPRARPYYTEEQRSRASGGDLEGLDLPPTLAIFAARMGARYIGSPMYDAYFNVFALPLVATLSEISASRASAGRRSPSARWSSRPSADAAHSRP
jgi:L-ornithine Nalpha-acyltransferase